MRISPTPVRKTVDLDDDVVQLLRDAVRDQGRSRNAVINDAVRRVLGAGTPTGHDLQGAVPPQIHKPER